MKTWLRLVYADGDVAATLLRPWRWSYASVALLYPFHKESEISDTLLLRPWRFYCALAVSVTIRVILTKISNRSGIVVQWNGGLRHLNHLKLKFISFFLSATFYERHYIKYQNVMSCD